MSNNLICCNCYYEKIGNDIKNITDELPFEIPNSWAWVRLKNLCNIKGGKRIPKGMSFLFYSSPAGARRFEVYAPLRSAQS